MASMLWKTAPCYKVKHTLEKKWHQQTCLMQSFHNPFKIEKMQYPQSEVKQNEIYLYIINSALPKFNKYHISSFYFISQEVLKQSVKLQLLNTSFLKYSPLLASESVQAP